jgi:predicted nuclease of predicted toxin-antitoxin system
MKFLADMGISPRVVEELRQKGHDAVHLMDEGLNRLPDGDVLDKTLREGRILLTHDLGFGELLAAGGGSLPSVIIFRLKDMRPANVSRHLFSVISQESEALDRGAICSVTEHRVRIRNLPVEKL